MSFIRAHRVEIFIFVLALAVRFLYLWLSFSAVHGDLVAVVNRGDGYFDIAQNLILGHGYSIAHQVPFVPTSYRTPGMPYFIAGVYFLLGSLWAVVIVQVIVGSAIPLLAMKLAHYLTRVRSVIVAVGIFLALEPTGVLFSTIFLSEAVFTFVFLLALLCLFQYWKQKAFTQLVACALMLSLATLVRPSIEYIPVVIIALLLWEERHHLSRHVFLRAGVFLLVFLVVLSPWLYRNYKTFGVVGLSSQQGAALYAIMVPSVLAVEDKTSFAQEYNSQIAGPNDTTFAESSEYTKRAVPILLAHPRALMLVSAETAFSFFTYDGTYDVLRKIGLDGDLFTSLNRAKLESGIQPSTPTLFLLTRPLTLVRFVAALAITPVLLVILGRATWLLITLGFFMGAWRSMRYTRQPIYACAAVGVVMYLMATTILVGFTVNYRYRMPVNMFMITFAMYEAVTLWPWVARKYTRQTHAPASAPIDATALR